MEFSSLPAWIPVIYLMIHSALVMSSHPTRRPGVLGVNLLLSLFFLFLVGFLPIPYVEHLPRGLEKLLFLWSPLIFMWWAYLWSKHTFNSIHPEGYSLDPRLVEFEAKFLGQPSLWWSRSGNRALTEVLHFCYTSYYFYTPFLGIFLDVSGRTGEFQEMSLAVLLGYLVSYTLFALTPVFGPRWFLLEQGLITADEQRQTGYLFTRLINAIMYGGPAHKGGAMPSSHSSTAVIFLVWCGWLWGWPGAIPASVLVAGMWAGSIYGRYHYVLDVAAGGLIGVLSLVAAALLT